MLVRVSFNVEVEMAKCECCGLESDHGDVELFGVEDYDHRGDVQIMLCVSCSSELDESGYIIETIVE